MGAIGLQYQYNPLMADNAPPGFTAAQERVGLLNAAVFIAITGFANRRRVASDASCRRLEYIDASRPEIDLDTSNRAG